MNEQALRELVRDAVARQLAGKPHAGPHDAAASRPLMLVADPSHYRYSSLPDSGGPCLIEPAVRCNHCGFCQSHGF
ncbi:MAG TPA: hypothetical protein VM364_21670 [Vicinamibacterales bacterium]|nr:hypothetical protein [Vicinamibacterales bacterium]